MTVAQWDGRSLAADLAYVKRVTGLSARRGVLAPLRTVTIAALGGVGTLTHYNYDAGVVVRAQVTGDLAATTVDFPELAAAVKAAGRGVVELERDGDRLVVAGPDGLNPGQMAERLEVAPTALSFHLKELSHAGLVSAERDGRNLIYRAEFEAMDQLLGFLTAECCQGKGCQVSKNR